MIFFVFFLKNTEASDTNTPPAANTAVKSGFSKNKATIAPTHCTSMPATAGRILTPVFATSATSDVKRFRRSPL